MEKVMMMMEDGGRKDDDDDNKGTTTRDKEKWVGGLGRQGGEEVDCRMDGMGWGTQQKE